MLFDSHAHYDDDKFDADRYEVIGRAFESGVTNIVNVSCNMDCAARSIQLAEKFEFVYTAAGIHPHDVSDIDKDTVCSLEKLCRDNKIVAIGEIGLDYYYGFTPREVQKRWFIRQIALARSLNLPVIIHDRDAHEDVFNIVKSENARTVGGVFHCYSGSVEMAREILKNDFYISIAGPVTYKNARKIVDVVKYVPADRLLIETDCPYLTPEPFRGKRNDSSYVRLVAEKIAEIKGVEYEEIAQITAENARELFGINR